MKIFSFPENNISEKYLFFGKYFTWTKHNLRFKSCCLFSGNFLNKELTIIQHHIFWKLRSKKWYVKRDIYLRDNLNRYIQLQNNNLNCYIQSQNNNLNCYIQSQTAQKLFLFHGDLPIIEMHIVILYQIYSLSVFFFF